MKNIFKFICLFICFFPLIFVGCNNQQPNLYSKGLELTNQIGIMVNDNNALKLLYGNTYDFSNFIADDYNRPTNVYSFSIPTAEQQFLTDKNITQEEWNSLSKPWKHYISKNLASSFINRVNIDVSSIADFSKASVLKTSATFEGKIKESIGYLFVFEKGTPITIIFSPETANTYSATGMFFLYDKCSSLESIQSLFSQYSSTVHVVL